MVNWKIINSKYCFSLSDNLLDIDDVWNSDKLIPYADALNSLCTNGFAEFKDGIYYVNTEDIYKLDEIDRQILNIPSSFPYSILIGANGVINRENFKFKLGFYDFVPNGTPINVSRVANILKYNQTNQTFLLNAEEFQLCERVDLFNSESRVGMDSYDMFKRAAIIRDLAKGACAYLDKYLESENVILPDDIILNLEYEDEVLKIRPSLPELEADIADSFTQTYSKALSVKNNYPIRDEKGNRTRIVFSREQTDQLYQLKRDFSYIKDPKRIAEIVQAPEKYFDTDIIDISRFYSDRVIDYGLYKPKCYPFISPYKSEWIPGVEIDNRVLGTTRIVFESEEMLEEFEQVISKAEEQGNTQVSFKETFLHIDDAKEVLKVSQKQFKNKHIARDESVISGNKVLLIQENDEELEYLYNIQDKQLPDKISLLTVNNLNPEIELKDHQKEGIAWLQYLYNESYKGGLLADDMGLGKTLQILYFINWYFAITPDTNRKPCLIVAPVSLLENWEAEYQKFFDLDVHKIKIDLFLSKDISKKICQSDIDKLSSCNLVLTNYETLRSCQLNFCAVDFSIIAIDEAQKIKTPGTMVTNALKALKGDFRVALTGTPVENSFLDLWCIVDFAVPGLLGNAKEFARKYQNPLKDKMTNIVELGNSLRNELGDYIKRRLKSGVDLKLPSKKLVKIPGKMPDVQYQRYSEEVNSVIQAREDGTLEPGAILGSIQRLKLIADHPYLLDFDLEQFSAEDLINSSAKLTIILGILNEIKALGEKVIIYSEFKAVQRMLRRIIRDYYGFAPFIINGDTPSSQVNVRKTVLTRQVSINKFESADGFNVIIMSPIAAGMGLNVVGANHVIHYSRHWNPAKEEQATDRVYRIGQTREVQVYFPMAISDQFDTFDVLLDRLLSNKKELADATLYPSAQTEVSQEELFNFLYQGLQKVDSEYIEPMDVPKMDEGSINNLLHFLMIKDGYTFNDKTTDLMKGTYDVFNKDGKGYLVKYIPNVLNLVDIQNITDALKAAGKKTNLFYSMICLSKGIELTIENEINNSLINLINYDQLTERLKDHPIKWRDVQSINTVSRWSS